MYCCWAMLPYFYAADHVNYARYGLVYVLYMTKLHDEILEKFRKGEHVMHHLKGHLNAIWSDMMMETSYIRHGKGSLRQGDLVGQTVRPDQVKKIMFNLPLIISSKRQK